MKFFNYYKVYPKKLRLKIKYAQISLNSEKFAIDVRIEPILLQKTCPLWPAVPWLPRKFESPPQTSMSCMWICERGQDIWNIDETSLKFKYSFKLRCVIWKRFSYILCRLNNCFNSWTLLLSFYIVVIFHD